MKQPVMSRADKEWQAKDDARTIATANEILADSKRKSAAISAAKTLVKEQEKTIQTLRKVTLTPTKSVLRGKK